MSKTVQWVEQVETWVLFDPMDFCSAKIYSESRVDENSPMEFHVRGGGKLTKNGKRYIYIYIGSTFQLDQPWRMQKSHYLGFPSEGGMSLSPYKRS